METKICSKCQVPFPATTDYFHKHSRNKDGLHSRCRTCRNTAKRQESHAMRMEAILAYSGGKRPCCACCGENEISFLQIDHQDRSKAVRKDIGDNGTALVRWLKKNNYPPGFQLLCPSCNFMKANKEVCPHQLRQEYLLKKAGVELIAI